MAVTLARLSEELRYDLVTFQDRPHLPALYDPWTLLRWVAGRTDRIRLAANVLSLPLRTPAVLARSAASLDLLSGGRLELAMGDADGAFSDAITAMGGSDPTPGEAVDALGEAVDVIRGVLDAGGWKTSTKIWPAAEGWHRVQASVTERGAQVRRSGGFRFWVG
jgi:alkanesulfonate monooxygenase SsuD/methylene tetrahydromethanopterin reductase-like flavin-dependent oxidoreductase (luciferase family)